MAGRGLANHPAEGLIPTPSSQPPTLGCWDRARQRVTIAAATSSASWGVWEPGEYLPSRSKFHSPHCSPSPIWGERRTRRSKCTLGLEWEIVLWHERPSWWGWWGVAGDVGEQTVNLLFQRMLGLVCNMGVPGVCRRWPVLVTKAGSGEQFRRLLKCPLTVAGWQRAVARPVPQPSPAALYIETVATAGGCHFLSASTCRGRSALRMSEGMLRWTMQGGRK